MIEADPAGRFVLHVDLALDKIFVWKFDERTGLLDSGRNSPPSRCRPETGRGISLFIRTAAGSTRFRRRARPSSSSTYEAATGRLTPRQTISTLPPGFAGSNFCSAILVSADGRFVYAGNRLHDSIAIFSIGADGTLTFVGEEWTRGSYPRSFAFDPTGEFLYCCNQRADNITVFRVDRETGGLTSPAFTRRRQSVDDRVPRCQTSELMIQGAGGACG